ncbi:hypothetical protein [Lyngbya sp. PCC 8106]|uniref:hypothetical protein n=1 Tax=Lyngbya sp. (strain PCC 8106) TaxID=313612 RepID=UPI0000EAA303|nr:hypothetical protein [Lyngbya sp. PCC 8106]EAW36920.1 hypothetical protein L8106_20937 [Lyngbya sp. PCC 8106]
MNVTPDSIEILKSLTGDIQPLPDHPEGEQTELDFSKLQTETPHQRVKRLAKQQKEQADIKENNLTPFLERFEKSKVSELTDEEATQICDELQRQIERFERTKRDLGLH